MDGGAAFDLGLKLRAGVVYNHGLDISLGYEAPGSVNVHGQDNNLAGVVFSVGYRG